MILAVHTSKWWAIGGTGFPCEGQAEDAPLGRGKQTLDSQKTWPESNQGFNQN